MLWREAPRILPIPVLLPTRRITTRAILDTPDIRELQGTLAIRGTRDIIEARGLRQEDPDVKETSKGHERKWIDGHPIHFCRPRATSRTSCSCSGCQTCSCLQADPLAASSASSSSRKKCFPSRSRGCPCLR